MHENSLKNLRPWSHGQTGNPNGRPTARSRLTERFIADVSLTWEQHGSAVLQKMATKEPSRFADMCSRLIPRDVKQTWRLQCEMSANDPKRDIAARKLQWPACAAQLRTFGPAGY